MPAGIHKLYNKHALPATDGGAAERSGSTARQLALAPVASPPPFCPCLRVVTQYNSLAARAHRQTPAELDLRLDTPLALDRRAEAHRHYAMPLCAQGCLPWCLGAGGGGGGSCRAVAGRRRWA